MNRGKKLGTNRLVFVARWYRYPGHDPSSPGSAEFHDSLVHPTISIFLVPTKSSFFAGPELSSKTEYCFSSNFLCQWYQFIIKSAYVQSINRLNIRKKKKKSAHTATSSLESCIGSKEGGVDHYYTHRPIPIVSRRKKKLIKYNCNLFNPLAITKSKIK